MCVITNCASMNVLGHISMCTCVGAFLGHILKWNCWVGGCTHFQLYQLPNCPPKWFYQQCFSKFPFSPFSRPLSPHITTAPQFSPKTTLGISSPLSLHPPNSLQPLPHFSSYKSPRTGMARPEWSQGRNCVKRAETSASWECGEDGRNSGTSIC